MDDSDLIRALGRVEAALEAISSKLDLEIETTNLEISNLSNRVNSLEQTRWLARGMSTALAIAFAYGAETLFQAVKTLHTH